MTAFLLIIMALLVGIFLFLLPKLFLFYVELFEKTDKILCWISPRKIQKIISNNAEIKKYSNHRDKKLGRMCIFKLLPIDSHYAMIKEMGYDSPHNLANFAELILLKEQYFGKNFTDGENKVILTTSRENYSSFSQVLCVSLKKEDLEKKYFWIWGWDETRDFLRDHSRFTKNSNFYYCVLKEEILFKKMSSLEKLVILAFSLRYAGDGGILYFLSSLRFFSGKTKD